MGTIFPLIVVLLTQSVLAQPNPKTQKPPPKPPKPPPIEIGLPDTPEAVPARSRGEKGAREDYNRRKRQLDRLLKRKKKEEPASLALNRKLLEESLKPRPMRHSFQVHLLYPFVSTSGSERENYTAEPSSNFLWFYRPIKDNQSLWTGFRTAFMNGSGSYDGTYADFSFAYFGPIIGLGNISRAPQSVGKDAFKNEDNIKDAMFSRHAFFVYGGLSAVYRELNIETGKEHTDEDFTEEKIGLDFPSLYLELSYSWIHHNAMGVNFLAGVQTGVGKIFYYAGIGASGWY